MKNRYLITGATGLIGSALVKKLISDEENTVICPVRNKDKALNMFSHENLQHFNNLILIDCNLEEFLDSLDIKTDYIIHCACPTASKFFVEHPVETINFGIQTTTSILKYAQANNVRSIVYLSSLEVYGTVSDDAKAINENFQGYVDLTDVRSSYNMMKRLCETLCYSYYKEYEVPVKMVRPSQIIPYNIEDNDNRIYAQFGKKAAAGEDIELHTIGDSARQYISIDDAVDGILTVLHKGKNGEAYNMTNESCYISAKEMAYFVQCNFNPHGKVCFNLRDDLGYAPTTRLRLDTSKVRDLGWEPKIDLFQMFKTLIDNLKQNDVK